MHAISWDSTERGCCTKSNLGATLGWPRLKRAGIHKSLRLHQINAIYYREGANWVLTMEEPGKKTSKHDGAPNKRTSQAVAQHQTCSHPISDSENVESYSTDASGAAGRAGAAAACSGTCGEKGGAETTTADNASIASDIQPQQQRHLNGGEHPNRQPAALPAAAAATRTPSCPPSVRPAPTLEAARSSCLPLPMRLAAKAGLIGP